MVGSSRQRVQKQKDLFPKVSREKQGTVSRGGVKRPQCPTGTVWMKRVRNIWSHAVLTDTLKTETSNFGIGS